MQISTVQPVFKLELNHKVTAGVAVIAKYDGTHPCLSASPGYDKVVILIAKRYLPVHNKVNTPACEPPSVLKVSFVYARDPVQRVLVVAKRGQPSDVFMILPQFYVDMIIIHHPHGGVASGRAQRSQAHGEVSELNLSQAVVALAAGPLRPDTGRDMLLIGSPTQILAYDVHENTDLFFKEAPDGVNIIMTGSFGKYTDTLAIIGGNSSVHGLTWEGEELFWNVVGGKVSSMIVFDFDKDGENELIIGSDDSYIRVLKNNQFITELPETGPVICLTLINEVRFAYGLANGTIGIYEEGIRLWRVKSKQNSISLQWSGETLVCCWANGRVDWREGSSGRVLRRVQMRANGAAMLLADYRSVGVADLVCVSTKGEVLGYPPYQENTGFSAASKKLPSDEDRLAITELLNKKQTLLVELQHYEANAANASTADDLERSATAMPSNTRLQVAVLHAPEENGLHLAISTNNDTIVRAAMVLAEGIFESGETLARHPEPSQLRSILHVPLNPPRDVPVDVHIKALVGYPDSEQFHIFELTKQLPRFSMYHLASPNNTSQRSSYVTFRITERVQRICIWVNQNFLLEDELELVSEDAKELHVNLTCLRDMSSLNMDFEADGQVKIKTHDIKLAGDIIQSLAVFLNLSDLSSIATFPEAEIKLREEMENASQIGEIRSRLAAETAERAQLITALLPAAQDAATYDYKEMLNRYKEVVMLNEELLTGCHVRRATQEQAVSSLKNLHTILQQAARLRVGKYSKAAVAASRKAVRDNNVEALVKILQHGDS